MFDKNTIQKLSIGTLRKTACGIIDRYHKDTAAWEAKIIAAETEKLEMAHEIAFLKAQLYGPKSEKSKKADDPHQQTIFGTAVEIVDEAPAAETTAADAITVPAHARKKKGHGRHAISKDLPSETIRLLASDVDRLDCDGNRLVAGGFERSEILHRVPEKFMRLIIEREILVSADTGETAFVTPHEPRIVTSGKLSDGFIHECVLHKYLLGLPIYRQVADLARHGVELAASTINDNVRAFADLYEPIHSAIGAAVFATHSGFIQADETHVRQMCNRGPQTNAGRGNTGTTAGSEPPDRSIRTCYFWAFLADKNIYFHYGTTRSSDEVRRVFGIPISDREADQVLHDADIDAWERGSTIGFLVCDAYAGYNPLFKHETEHGPKRVACWVHVRRKFKEREAIDKNAASLVSDINELLRLEKTHRKHCQKHTLNKDAAAAYTLEQRRALSIPKLEAFKKRLDMLLAVYEETTPDGKMAQALRYCLNQWDALSVYTTNGFLPMDNNAAERAIRPITVGRKNYLFVGSEDGGTWAAICYSIIESCRMQKINPRDYLEYVTPRLLRSTDRKADAALLIPSAVSDILRKK